MAFVMRRALAAGCIALLLAAGVWTLRGLHAPDPRARGAWAAGASALTHGSLDVHLYIPACPIAAVRVQAAPGHTGDLTATATLRPTPAGDAVLSPAAQYQIGASGFVDIPLATAPARERIRLRLSSETPGLMLDARRPVALVPHTTSRLGLFPCIVDGRRGLAWLLLVLLGLHLTGLGWLAATVMTRRRPEAQGPGSLWDSPNGPLVASGVVATTLLLYALAVPPFEPPDELAHLEYARHVAVTGGLPRAVPPPESEWRSSAYEWVQQPAYYLVTGAILRATGDAWARPSPEAHPQSRLAGGPDVNIYRHPDTRSPAGALQALWTLRWLSVLMALVTVWCAARAVTLTTGDPRLGAASAASLALVHQWAAVMGIVSTDPPATLAAAVATLLLCRFVETPGHGLRAATTGAVTGLAYAVKATSVFLLPMVGVAMLAVVRRSGLRAAVPHIAACAMGVVATAAWIPLRAWMVFGDPLARAFKREVLTIGGFRVIEGPPVFSWAFADDLRRMVFEAFWARFGSLGAGPLPGTRLWWIYGAMTCILLLLLAAGTVRSTWTWWQTARGRQASARSWMVVACVVGVLVGTTLWAWVNLVPQTDMIVHWTPRHVLPLTVPLLVVVAAGLQATAAWVPHVVHPVLRVASGVTILVLGVTGLAVLRSVLLGFHFGY